MSTLQQIRTGMSQMWDSLAHGWRDLYRTAANAITRFTPQAHKGLPVSVDEDFAMHGGWSVLAADVFDDDERVVVRMEVPGMEADEFEIEVIDGMLVVSGEKRVQRERSDGYYHVHERAYGRFERAIGLPDEVDVERAQAKYSRGVLRVELPKSESARKRRVRVKVH